MKDKAPQETGEEKTTERAGENLVRDIRPGAAPFHLLMLARNLQIALDECEDSRA
jgi:hypothetical protein